MAGPARIQRRYRISSIIPRLHGANRSLDMDRKAVKQKKGIKFLSHVIPIHCSALSGLNFTEPDRIIIMLQTVSQAAHEVGARAERNEAMDPLFSSYTSAISYALSFHVVTIASPGFG